MTKTFLHSALNSASAIRYWCAQLPMALTFCGLPPSPRLSVSLRPPSAPCIYPALSDVLPSFQTSRFSHAYFLHLLPPVGQRILGVWYQTLDPSHDAFCQWAVIQRLYSRLDSFVDKCTLTKQLWEHVDHLPPVGCQSPGLSDSAWLIDTHFHRSLQLA